MLVFVYLVEAAFSSPLLPVRGARLGGEERYWVGVYVLQQAKETMLSCGSYRPP